MAGVECVIDVASLPDQEAATEFFTTAAHNLQEVGARAGVERIVVVSIIGCDRFAAGYNAAKLARGGESARRDPDRELCETGARAVPGAHR